MNFFKTGFSHQFEQFINKSEHFTNQIEHFINKIIIIKCWIWSEKPVSHNALDIQVKFVYIRNWLIDNIDCGFDAMLVC